MADGDDEEAGPSQGPRRQRSLGLLVGKDHGTESNVLEMDFYQASDSE